MINNKQNPTPELSATHLATQLKMDTNEMFQLLVDKKLICRINDGWELTQLGEQKGGVYRQHTNYPRYIVWPPSILSELNESQGKQGSKLITATAIGDWHQISASRINSILSELGWIKRDTAVNGWQITDFGKRAGGIQSTFKTGVPYVRWPQNILENKTLVTSIQEAKGEIASVPDDQTNTSEANNTDIRNNYQRPPFRTQDGHYVRSKSEALIDNWLYIYKIVHAYERKIPNIDEDILSDFYLPTGRVFIEYWGMDDEKYLAKKKWKLEIYKKNSIDLIELTEKDVANLDDTLAAKLRKYQVLIE